MDLETAIWTIAGVLITVIAVGVWGLLRMSKEDEV